MTQQQAGRYATQCRKAQAQAKRESREYIKPERPDANRLESVATIINHTKKDTKALQIRMKVVSEQMEVLVDFFDDVTKDNPGLREYQRIADYLLGSLIEIEERIKLI